MIDLKKSKAARAFFDSIIATQRDFHRYGSGLYASEHSCKWTRGGDDYTLRARRDEGERGLVYVVYLDRVNVYRGVLTEYVGRTCGFSVDTVDVLRYGQKVYRFYAKEARGE